jgi:hypothetical protein
MTDAKGIITVTLIVSMHLIQNHQQNILAGNGIRITIFKIIPKYNYDDGECDRIISIYETSIVEIVTTVCKEYNYYTSTSTCIVDGERRKGSPFQNYL